MQTYLDASAAPVMTVHEDGTVEFHSDGPPQCKEDPAAESGDGYRVWLRNNKFHRDDGPALVSATRSEWWVYGRRHRKDGPAVESGTTREWWAYGKLHREDGPAQEGDTLKSWWVNGVQHREDGPAVEDANGTKEWWRNGLRHRDDGPAVIKADGSFEWWVNGHEPDAGEMAGVLERIQQKLARAEKKEAAERYQALRAVFTQGVAKQATAPRTARFKPRELRLQK